MRILKYQNLLIALSLLVLCLNTSIFAQRKVVVRQQDVNYVLRERDATQQIKSKLTFLRQGIQQRNLTFTVGYTIPMDRNLENITGDVIPADMSERAEKVNLQALQLLKVDVEAEKKFMVMNPRKIPKLKFSCIASLRKWDWRKSGKVTGVRDQMSCGSCWSFAVIGALESSYMIRNNRTTDESEQYVLADSGGGSCAGGNRSTANNFLVSNGTAQETVVPYTATSGPANPGVATPYNAVATGFVNAAAQNPTVAQLKQAMCQYGPLSVSVMATPYFQGYTGGVFNEGSTPSTNHAVVLIGWDDDKGAWLIKNSWGNGWGSTAGYGTEKGYMWIAYNSNRIGRWAQWIKAKSIYFVLPPRYYEIIKRPMIDPRIIKQPVRKVVIKPPIKNVVIKPPVN